MEDHGNTLGSEKFHSVTGLCVRGFRFEKSEIFAKVVPGPNFEKSLKSSLAGVICSWQEPESLILF